ncbi:MAG: tagatose 6-phosphate kinase [Actinomycetes bacterium]|jgi:tagatose 6-phosphate kinase
MIVTVTPNIALDITYSLDSFELYSAMRVYDVAERAGGKGINVSRVLHTLGISTMTVGMVGGVVGAAITANLVESNIDHRLGRLEGQTRRSIGIVDRSVGDATVLNEAGPHVSEDEWARLITLVREQLATASVLVISGSLPPAAPSEGVGQLAALAAEAGIPAIVDTSGAALIGAVEVGKPALVKPNIHELADALGTNDPVAGGRELIMRGAGAVAVSMGAEGMAIITGEQCWRAKPPEFIKGNPTGAGDASVSALAAGLAEHKSWDECLRNAVALSAAAVAHPQAGSFDDDVYRRLLDTTHVEEF